MLRRCLLVRDGFRLSAVSTVDRFCQDNPAYWERTFGFKVKLQARMVGISVPRDYRFIVLRLYPAPCEEQPVLIHCIPCLCQISQKERKPL